jgi:CBS domain containing-hemolysin-like protein
MDDRATCTCSASHADSRNDDARHDSIHPNDGLWRTVTTDLTRPQLLLVVRRRRRRRHSKRDRGIQTSLDFNASAATGAKVLALVLVVVLVTILMLVVFQIGVAIGTQRGNAIATSTTNIIATSMYTDDPTITTTTSTTADTNTNTYRFLQEQGRKVQVQMQDPLQVPVETQQVTDIPTSSSTSTFWKSTLPHLIAIFVCIAMAAVASGLTLGLLGIDTLFLLIKERATSSTQHEQQMARAILPIVQEKHLLLVTLLVCNALTNEALPLLLNTVVSSPIVNVMISVTLVLLFGEIIPSAIFTGPKQLEIAYTFVPTVKFLMCFFYPIAKPIALMLDHILHKEDDEEDLVVESTLTTKKNEKQAKSTASSSASYTRSELAALIRIQYEDRLARKQRQKLKRKVIAQPSVAVRPSLLSTTTVAKSTTPSGSIDFTSKRQLLPTATTSTSGSDLSTTTATPTKPLSKRALKNQSYYRGTTMPLLEQQLATTMKDVVDLVMETNRNDESAPLLLSTTISSSIDPNGSDQSNKLNDYSNIEHRSNFYCSIGNSNRDDDIEWNDHSIHRDEISMMEGALQMQTKVALDVYTPKRRVFTIPSNMILNERNIVKIYASGYSRIPVHLVGNKNAIVGILVTKHLIVIHPDENRSIMTLPLRKPRCVSPSMPLTELLNMFQSGGSAAYGGGHLAIVCARPSLGEKVFYETSSTTNLVQSSCIRSNGSSTNNRNDRNHGNVYGINEGTASSVPDSAIQAATVPVLPDEAGYMGIITLEDVLEMLLQEHIYDEMDKVEQNAIRTIVKFVHRWRRRHLRKKQQLADGNLTNKTS